MPEGAEAEEAAQPRGSEGAGAPAAPDVGTEAREPGEVGEEPSPTLRIGRGVLALVGMLAAYYAVPVGEVPSSWDILLAAAGILVGLAAIVYVALRQVRAMARFHEGDPSVRLDVLVLLVVIVVPLFALGYYAVEQGDAAQFAELETKTDALYFTMSTLGTVGFGDVHAEGQLARALVTLQIAFDLVFVAALATVLTSQLRARMSERRPGGSSPG